MNMINEFFKLSRFDLCRQFIQILVHRIIICILLETIVRFRLSNRQGFSTWVKPHFCKHLDIIIKVSEFVSLIIFWYLFFSEIFSLQIKTLLDLLDLTYNLISGEANFNTKVTMLNLRPDKLQNLLRSLQKYGS